MRAGGAARLHWVIAWRHLRAGDRAPAFVWPLMVIAVYLIAVGGGFLVAASMGAPPPAEAAPILPDLVVTTTPSAAAADYYGLVGGTTLFVGVMMLIGGVLSRIFTLLATVIIISVMLGCMALVIVLSLMTGLEVELRDKILGQLAHIRIDREDGRPFTDYREVTDLVASQPGIVGASPYLQGEVMVRNGLNRQGGILTGIIPERHATVSYLPEIVKEGRYEYLDHPERIPDPSFSFDIVGEPTPIDAPRDEDSEGPPDVIEIPVGAGVDTDGGDDEAAAPAPTFGVLPKMPPMIPRMPSSEVDEGWEDPEVEIARLRAAGELPAADAPDPDDDDWDRPDEPRPSGRRGKGRVEPAAAVDRGERLLRRRATIGPIDPDEGEGWEDPEEEIARLRAAGELPPAPAVDEPPPADEIEGGGQDEPPASADEREGAGGEAVVAPVLIGNEKARELIAHVGDRVQLITPIGRSTPAGRIPGVMAVRVAGVFDAEHYEYDRWLVYAPLDVVQAFLRTGDRISGIEVKVDDLTEVRARKEALQRVIAASGRGDLRVRDWQELNASLFSAMALEKLAVFIALLCVILVASFGILGSNLMSVLEKSKEIAILKTMGCSDSLIQRVFIAEGLCMGILGGIMGIATGIALCLVLDRFGLPLSGNLHGFETLPVAIDPLEVTLVGVSALIIVWLSSLYPARVASRMRPVEALRKAEA